MSEILKFTTVLSVPTETPTKGTTNRMSPTLNQDSAFGDRQFMVITSEKQCRIVALPSQNCVYRLQITETDFVVRAEIVSMKGLSVGKLAEGIFHRLTQSLKLQIAFVLFATSPTVISWHSVCPAFDSFSTSISFHWPI